MTVPDVLPSFLWPCTGVSVPSEATSTTGSTNTASEGKL